MAKPHPELPNVLSHQHADSDCSPLLLRWRADSDQRQLIQDLHARTSVAVFDEIHAQLRGLLETRYVRESLSRGDLDRLVSEHLDGCSPQEYGVWAYYPWSNRLVHVLDEEEFAELRTSRNRYKITVEEQARLGPEYR